MPIPNNLRQIRADLENLRPSLECGLSEGLVLLRPAVQAVGEEPSIPSAMRTLSQRLVGTIDVLASNGENPREDLAKLAQGIAKLVRAIDGIDVGTVAATKNVKAATMESTVPDSEEMDLLERFASRQKGELEEFEVAILEREKGSTAGDQFVKRYLHTLKGEFGVLDLGEWSNLVHGIETELEERRIGTEGLLRFKDLLGERLGLLGGSQGRRVSEEDARLLFGTRAAKELAAAVEEPTSTNFAGDPSFLVDFIAEGGDHIHNMEKSLLKLEVNPSDDESINMVFRSCHTLKGLAGFLELKDIQRLAHAAESLMDRARNHLIVLAPQHVDVLLETMDTFRILVDGLEKVVSGEAMETPKNLEALIDRLVDADYLPPLPALAPEKSGQKMGELLIGMGVAPGAIEKALKSQEDGDSRHLGEILIQSGDANPRDVGQILGQKAQAEKAPSGKTLAVEETIRVPVQRLDLLIDAIGEAVIAQSMVWADPRLQEVRDLSLEKKIGQASLMLRQIQELSMSLRMVGIRSTFQKMSRLVRDLARKMDKQIELCMEGEDTELDKTVVENIGDPLVHMVRNSVDHGIEMPDDRVAAGKPPQGKIHLRAYHKAGSVYIEIEDDGKGLDREAILRKAVAGGKARADVSYSDAEVYQMVFLPGLSTAKAVTDVSGRGVGMDVVKRNIEALRGTVEIRSEKGKGSCFVIRLPLTLAIIQGMVVRSGDERYIVPTLSILTTVRPDAEHLSTVVGKGELLNLRGDLVRLIRLQRIFGVPAETIPDEESSSEGTSNEVVIVVEDAFGHKIGIVVDEILEQQQVVIKNIGGGMGQVPGITGGAVMSDGSVSLILDVGAVVKIASE